MSEGGGVIIFFICVVILGAVLCGSLYLLWRSQRALRIARNGLASAEIQQKQLRVEINRLQNKTDRAELSDALTGLPERRVLEDRLNVMLNQGARYQLTCGVMYLSIDRFKVINDAMGVAAGNELLKIVAQRLAECVRKVDTISRFDEDRFVVILPQLSKAETAAYIASRLLVAIAEPCQTQGQAIYLTASIGIAIFPTDGSDAATLIHNADSALQQAKMAGRNTYQFYREDMQTESKRELLLGAGLCREDLFQAFSLYYQPEIHLPTQRIVCMKAILQWQHTEFGLLMLSDFLCEAEMTGKIGTISEWLTRTACQHMLAWREQGFSPAAVLLPLSQKQLENAHFVQQLAIMLQDYRLEAQCLIFELMDSVQPIKIELLEKNIRMMKHLGVQIAINNFGTGSLSLKNLRRLPIDFFRIDASLIKDIAVNRESEAIARMVIALAKTLQARVVAEGVTSPGQKKLLIEMGCEIMQGRLFGAPALAREFTAASTRKLLEVV